MSGGEGGSSPPDCFLGGGQRDRLGDKESREGQTYQRGRPSSANNIWNVNEAYKRTWVNCASRLTYQCYHLSCAFGFQIQIAPARVKSHFKSLSRAHVPSSSTVTVYLIPGFRESHLIVGSMVQNLPGPKQPLT